MWYLGIEIKRLNLEFMYRISYIFILWLATILAGGIGFWAIHLKACELAILFLTWGMGVLFSIPSILILSLLFFLLNGKIKKTIVLRLIILGYTLLSLILTFYLFLYDGKVNDMISFLKFTLYFIVPATIFSLILPIENKEQVVSS